MMLIAAWIVTVKY